MDDGRLVAAVEIVSPANKDRPDNRRAFAAKCASMLTANVCVAVVDIVTERKANVYGQLLESLGVTDPSLTEEPPAIYAAACRWLKRRPTGILEAWAHPLEIGRALPTLPLWLDEDTWVLLDLESTYEETCRNLRLP
jgi:hypothetical protein